jgi:ATP-binding cassette subfamily C protein
MLLTPLYSLQVLDRVIGSGNKETLLMLSLIIAFIYLVYTMLQIARSFTLIKVGEWLDNNVSPILFSRSVASAATRQVGTSQLLRDFQTVKTFLTSTGINTMLDAPWSVIYVIAIFMIHPFLGWLTVFGGIIIVSTAFINAIATNRTLGEATDFAVKSMNQAEIATRNAEVVEAMGMMKNVTSNWRQFNNAALAKQSVASYRNGVISNISRFIRNIMQMAVTGIGAYVVISTGSRDMTTGGMIMSSILVGRALAPFDNAIELWKSISSTIKSYKSIQNIFNTSSLREESMPIPNVDGHLTLENVYYSFSQNQPSLNQPDQPKYILKGVSFAVEPGQLVAIIGPSATGKSTLAKIITGVWKSTSGSVRLDGAEIYRWNREDFGRHVGYLPQGIELFSGTIKQNIARLSENPDPEKVIEAAKMAGAHEMILKFPDEYDSDIGVAGSNLSGGQRQRIGLARAFYNNPKLVVLDEPNSNLDEAGEIALANALKQAKSKGTAVIIISHRPSILSVVDKIVVIQDGTVVAYGNQEEIRGRVQMLNSGTIHINQDKK